MLKIWLVYLVYSITSLYNYAQPLIRYEISDCLIWNPYDERYPFCKIKSLTGRNEDLMWFKDKHGNKDFLHPLAIEGFCMEGMLDYQFIQNNHDSFELDIEVTQTADKDRIHSEMITAIQAILYKKSLKYVQFIIMFVDEILPDKKTGKKALIVKQKGV